MTIRAVLWDFGGVIMRTGDWTPRNQLADDLGVDRKYLIQLVFSGPLGLRAQLGEITPDELWENVRLELGLSPEAMGDFQDRFWAGDEVDYDLVDYVRSLRPRYTTGILSNAWRGMQTVLVEDWKIADAFDEFIISGETGIMKPDPRIYQIALERVGVAPEQVVFIDDFPENVEGARAVSMHAISFQNTEQVKADLEDMLSTLEST
jgi:epoxide hydrolase-like predicted phosphatase